MPVDVTIDASRRIAFFRFSGVVTDDDLLRVTAESLADPRFSVVLDQITDLSDVTSMRVTSDGLRRKLSMTERLDRHPGRAGAKIAVVAPGDEAFGVARMYEMLRDETPVEVRVFREAGPARTWLGLAPEAGPARGAAHRPRGPGRRPGAGR